MPRRRSAKGTSVGELTPDVYFRAYRLFCANKTDREILRIIGLTRQQLDALYHVGIPAKRGSKDEALPPFVQRLAEEDAQLTEAAREIGNEVSRRGVVTLRNALINAQSAGLLVNRLLREINDRIAEAGDGPIGANNLPGDGVLQVLAALRPFADLGPVANAWSRIYAKPGATTNNTQNNFMVNLPPGGEMNLPAALSVYRRMAGDEAKNQLVAAIAGEMASWSEEEIARYAMTGEEPTGAVIDVPSSTTEEDAGAEAQS